MTSNVTKLPPRDNMTVDEAIGDVATMDLANVLIVGTTKENTYVIRSSRMTRECALWLSEQLRMNALGIETT